ncbi:type II secretion system F family protein [Maliponia aquimaris]|uniref:Bacterial type II secretion system protein F domain protein n=1 Tax=Maliponia aquimaris TaxID=1673631 RepID=A0A238KHJ7_9RHOB|nr:type II secretion system F family protein [Maliponia aquimaris]SMX42295.1 Bacterial type II secretion system protein F domain protein [Maliponia aquimaris]
MLSAEPIIYGGIFLGVLILVNGVYLVAFGHSISLTRKVNRRLEMLDKGERREDVLAKLRKEMDQHMKSRSLPIYSMLASKAQKAALAFTPQQLVMVMVAASVFAFVGLTVGTDTNPAVRGAMSAFMGIGGVFFWVSHRAKKRVSMIEEQLPEAVELMVRSLRVGHPFSAAISIVAKEMKDPLATEFGIIADESTYGRDVGEALKHMAERLDMQDLRFLAVAVAIQQQAGGNLAEILDGLARVIRSRFRLFRRVKAITAEAQWSGKFLSGFPIAALLFIQVAKPDYYDEVLDHPWFIPACFIVGIMLAANMLVMRWLVNIKV